MQILGALLQLQRLLQRSLHFAADPRSTAFSGDAWAFPIPTTCGPHRRLLRLPRRIRLPCAARHSAASPLTCSASPCSARRSAAHRFAALSHLHLASFVPGAEASCSAEEIHDGGGPRRRASCGRGDALHLLRTAARPLPCIHARRCGPSPPWLPRGEARRRSPPPPWLPHSKEELEVVAEHAKMEEALGAQWSSRWTGGRKSSQAAQIRGFHHAASFPGSRFGRRRRLIRREREWGPRSTRSSEVLIHRGAFDGGQGRRKLPLPRGSQRPVRAALADARSRWKPRVSVSLLSSKQLILQMRHDTPLETVLPAAASCIPHSADLLRSSSNLVFLDSC
jgi:hypothetical protein